MRVSLPICVASCLLTIVLSWSMSTRSRDFLSSPSEYNLNLIRAAATQANPTAQGMGNALVPSRPSQNISPVAVILPEHLATPPRLDDFQLEARHGTQYLIDLAGLLSENYPERALTCWERVIDSSQADARECRLAADRIAELKKTTPPWNEDPTDGLIVVIQAGTGPTTAALLDPILKRVGADMQQASSGVITIETKVSAGDEDLVDEGLAPVAIWMSGPTENSTSTEILSFSTPVDSMDGLDEMLKHSLYRIIRLHLKEMDKFRPLPKPDGQNLSGKLLDTHISRILWLALGESLQTIS